MIKRLFQFAVLTGPCCFFFLSSWSYAHDPGIKVEKLLQTTHSWDGTRYAGYPTGQPEITVLKITVPPNTALGLASAPDDQRRVCSVRRNYFGEKGYPGTPGNPCGASLSGVRQYNSPWLHDQSTSRVNRLLCRRGGPTPQYQSKVRSFITRYGPLGPGWKPSTIPSWPEHESNPVSNDDIAIPAREIVQHRRSRRRHKLRGRSQKRRSHRRESTEYG